MLIENELMNTSNEREIRVVANTIMMLEDYCCINSIRYQKHVLTFNNVQSPARLLFPPARVCEAQREGRGRGRFNYSCICVYAHMCLCMS